MEVAGEELQSANLDHHGLVATVLPRLRCGGETQRRTRRT